MRHLRISSVISLVALISLIIAFIYTLTRTIAGGASIVYAGFDGKFTQLSVLFILTVIVLIIGFAVTFSTMVFSPTKYNTAEGCFCFALFAFFIILYFTNKDEIYFAYGINENCTKYLIFLAISGLLYIASGFIKEGN